ncbi:hypothetical protein KCP73_05185 [Salmonella enterica subsp. enterica]|nr:hypothetical protein KCP73_05185 [Salmonella enterica subsp. enterica]
MPPPNLCRARLNGEGGRTFWNGTAHQFVLSIGAFLTKRLRDKTDTDACQMSGYFGFHIRHDNSSAPEAAVTRLVSVRALSSMLLIAGKRRNCASVRGPLTWSCADDPQTSQNAVLELQRVEHKGISQRSAPCRRNRQRKTFIQERIL